MERYEDGQAVQILDRGTWQAATLVSYRGSVPMVQKEDGSRRLVSNPTEIRSLDLILDNVLELCYNTRMIVSPAQFKVSIAPGTLSYQIEEGLLDSTAELNSTPATVNQATWEKNAQRLTDELSQLTDECRQISGVSTFRPNATADCAKVFGARGHAVETTKTGRNSLDKEALEQIAATGDDLAQKVILAREARTKLSQLESWKPIALAGSVQAQWNQLGTPHGRYSCESPNLQNRILEIRETIEAPPGYVLMSADLAQIELMTWASLSKDKLLTEIFTSGQDLHERMGQEALKAAPNVRMDDRTLRELGKTLNFALLYLMQPWSLARRLRCDQDTARALIEAWEARAPGAASYRNDFLKTCMTTGYTFTPWGRCRDLSDQVKAAKSQGLKHEVRKSLWHHHNAGLAAEILKLKQVKIHRRMRKIFAKEQATLLLQMFDELIYQVKEEHVPTMEALVKEAFGESIPGVLSFKFDFRSGKTWFDISK